MIQRAMAVSMKNATLVVRETRPPPAVQVLMPYPAGTRDAESTLVADEDATFRVCDPEDVPPLLKPG